MELDWILQITREKKTTVEVKYIALERRCCYKAKAPHVGRHRCTGGRWVGNRLLLLRLQENREPGCTP
jgi:hypothetical protein